MIRRYIYKGLGIVSPFCVWFLKKNIFFEILSNMCITVVCFSGFDVISFKINLIFQPKLFFYMTKKSRQKYKYIENKKSFYLRGIKKIAHHFWRTSSCRILSQTWECTFKQRSQAGTIEEMVEGQEWWKGKKTKWSN